MIAIRGGRNDDIQCKNAYELLWEKENRFKSINSFRKIVDELPNAEE